MANLDPTFSPLPFMRQQIPHSDSSASARNCSAACSACSRSPAPTPGLSLREERIEQLEFLHGVYMDLVFWCARNNDAAEFSAWREEVERTELELAALRQEAVCA